MVIFCDEITSWKQFEKIKTMFFAFSSWFSFFFFFSFIFFLCYLFSFFFSIFFFTFILFFFFNLSFIYFLSLFFLFCVFLRRYLLSKDTGDLKAMLFLFCVCLCVCMHVFCLIVIDLFASFQLHASYFLVVTIFIFLLKEFKRFADIIKICDYYKF